MSMLSRPAVSEPRAPTPKLRTVHYVEAHRDVDTILEKEQALEDIKRELVLSIADQLKAGQYHVLGLQVRSWKLIDAENAERLVGRLEIYEAPQRNVEVAKAAPDLVSLSLWSLIWQKIKRFWKRLTAEQVYGE